jgi:hypothetical protein
MLSSSWEAAVRAFVVAAASRALAEGRNGAREDVRKQARIASMRGVGGRSARVAGAIHRGRGGRVSGAVYDV